MLKDTFIWEEGSQVASCVLFDTATNETFVGMAKCAEEDLDFASSKTGLYIAQQRATIKYLKAQKKKAQIKVNTLHDFYFSVNTSKHFDPKEYLERKLMKHYHRAKLDIKTYDTTIELYENSLAEFIEQKGKLFAQLKAKRNNPKGYEQDQQEIVTQRTEILSQLTEKQGK